MAEYNTLVAWGVLYFCRTFMFLGSPHIPPPQTIWACRGRIEHVTQGLGSFRVAALGSRVSYIHIADYSAGLAEP